MLECWSARVLECWGSCDNQAVPCCPVRACHSLVWTPGSRLSDAGLVRTSSAQTSCEAGRLWLVGVLGSVEADVWKRKRGYCSSQRSGAPGYCPSLPGVQIGYHSPVAVTGCIGRNHLWRFCFLHLADAAVPSAPSSYCARSLVPPYAILFPTRRSGRGVLTAEAHLVSAPRPNPTLVGCPNPPSSHSHAVGLRLAR